MDVIIGLAFSFIALLFGIWKGIYIGIPLALCLIIFSIIGIRKGNSIKDILLIMWSGGKKAFIVLEIFLLIGIITAVWLSAGTVPAVVYYGIKFMNPKFFILYAFLISSIISYILGTSFGTVGTVGVALMVMAKGGNINPNLAAGAIISGCYFGDRTSPMSSCVNLLANMTRTELYPLQRRLLKTTIVPFIFVSVLYLFFSFNSPLNVLDNQMETEIINIYKINIIVLFPAILMLILSSFKVDVKLSMVFSIILGMIIAVIVQEVSIGQLVKSILLGYSLDSSIPLSNIMKGGGMFSMVKAGFVVFISCSMTGILEKINIFEDINKLFENINTRWKLFIATALVSLFAASLGGNQSIAVVLTSQIMIKVYESFNIDKYELATDIGNTAVILSPTIPWNIANLVPATTLNVKGIEFVPYAFYLYIPFIINLLFTKEKPKGNCLQNNF